MPLHTGKVLPMLSVVAYWCGEDKGRCLLAHDGVGLISTTKVSILRGVGIETPSAVDVSWYRFWVVKIGTYCSDGLTNTPVYLRVLRQYGLERRDGGYFHWC